MMQTILSVLMTTLQEYFFELLVKHAFGEGRKRGDIKEARKENVGTWLTRIWYEKAIDPSSASHNDLNIDTTCSRMSTTIEEEEAEKRKQWRAEYMRQRKLNSRISFPFEVRLPFAASVSFVAGMALGMTHGSQSAGFRFRAENAHRLPTTPTGWYLYHKSKNYNMALGGVKEGFKMGARVSFWTAGFFSIEEMFDRYRGTKDFFNTVIASLTVAGGFSLWSMLSSFPTLPPTSTDDLDRPIPHNAGCENGEDRIGYWIMLWLSTRRAGSGQRQKAGLC
jgi:hypothetical protein